MIREEVSDFFHTENIFETYENHISEESPRFGEFECPGRFLGHLLDKAKKS